MTIGIYKLEFNNTDKVYIGQSTDIERRYKEHLNDLFLNKGHGKLQEAYNLYGDPKLVILEVSNIDDLNTLENGYISKYDSYANGFNTLKEAGYPLLRGTDSPHSIYTREVYISIFKELVHTDKYAKDIAKELGVTETVVTGISLCRTHIWLSEEFPIEYTILKSKIGNRQRKIKGEVTLRSPEGELFELDCSIREFARIHKLNSPAHISNLVNGKRKSYMKWTLYKG